MLPFLELSIKRSHDEAPSFLRVAENQKRGVAPGRLDFDDRSTNAITLIAAQALSTKGRTAVNRRTLSRFLLDLRPNNTDSSQTSDARLARDTAIASIGRVVRRDRKVELVLTPRCSSSRARLSTSMALTTCTNQVVDSSAALASGEVLAAFVLGRRLLFKFLQKRWTLGLSYRVFSSSSMSRCEGSSQRSLWKPRSYCRALGPISIGP